MYFTSVSHSHSNLAFWDNFYILWTLTIHVITKSRPFRYISNRFWKKCKFMFLCNFSKFFFQNVKKSPKFQSFCPISYCFWDKCYFWFFFLKKLNFDFSIIFLNFRNVEKCFAVTIDNIYVITKFHPFCYIA